MAEYTDITGDIKAKLEEIPGIGMVYEYERAIVELGKFIQCFQDPTGKILGWEMARTQVSEKWLTGVYYANNRMVLRGYMGLQDALATSVTFQQLINTVRAKFRTAQFADPMLGLTYADYDSPDNSPVQVGMISDRMFGAVLCHYVEVHIAVQERIVA
jgi:hypothetical protein